MTWYRKTALSFVFGSGVLLCSVALFSVCAGVPLGRGVGVLAVGVAALFSNVPWLSAFLKRRTLRGIIRARRGLGRAADALSSLVALLTAHPATVRRFAMPVAVLFFLALSVDVALATGPWVMAVQALCMAFDGVIGKGLAIIAVIIAGLMFAFGEGGSKSAIAGLIFGAGMVLAAPQFLTWVGLTATC